MGPHSVETLYAESPPLNRLDVLVDEEQDVLVVLRLGLFQAQAEIRAVASILSGLAEVVPEEQAAYLEDAVTVLDESLAFLPRSPLQAADWLEGAWQMLLEGLPEELPEETAAEPAP